MKRSSTTAKCIRLLVDAILTAHKIPVADDGKKDKSKEKKGPVTVETSINRYISFLNKDKLFMKVIKDGNIAELTRFNITPELQSIFLNLPMNRRELVLRVTGNIMRILADKKESLGILPPAHPVVDREISNAGRQGWEAMMYLTDEIKKREQEGPEEKDGE